MTPAKVSDHVYMIDTLALGNVGAVAAYVLKGSKVALVDCGYASSHETVLQGLRELGILPSEVDYVIPTHVHLDHAGAAGHLVRRMPRSRVFAHERAVPHLVDPTRLVQSATNVFGKELIDLYGLPEPIPQERVTAVGQELHLDLGGISITAVHSPGHAPHQISVFVEEEKLLLSADAVGIVYPGVASMIPTTPPPSLDPEKLRETIDVLAQMGSSRLLVPHFGPRSDVVGVFETTKEKTRAWIEKTDSMKKARRTVDEMVAELKSEVARDSGIAESGISAYATSSIRTSVLGILHYLEKRA